METPILLAVPNVSEGREAATIGEIGRAFIGGDGAGAAFDGDDGGAGGGSGAPVRLLDVHSDRDHHRSVFTLAGGARELADSLLSGARTVVERVDVTSRERDDVGQHPHVGALDVVPIVYLDLTARGAAFAEALVVADRIGDELGVPVFLYGELTASGSAVGRARSEVRRGGIGLLAERMEAELEPIGPGSKVALDAGALESIRPDFGPGRPHPTAGATLVAARPPLVAFNLELAQPATPADARRIASLIREGGPEGLPGLRAIGVALSEDRAQVSMNVERPLEVPLAIVIEAVRRHARVASAELVGLAPLAALEGLPEEIPMPGFDPARHVIENAIGC
jgi:glutamate formiminotransferase/glutamate formiminotransferase/formiminotetrahydrofolate cyclodeaminase